MSSVCRSVVHSDMFQAQSPRTYKIVVLGHAFVGKSALTIQFVHNAFNHNCDPTIEDSYYKQYVVDNKSVLLDILDTSGEEHYEMLREQWIHAGEGFLLVYSITSRHSFDDISNFHQQICRVKRQDAFPVVLVANKCDCEYERQVYTDEGHALARDLECKLFETSAKTGVNVDRAFSDLVREINNHNKIKDQDPSPSPSPSSLPPAPTGGIISRIWKEWVGRNDGEPKIFHLETEAATHKNRVESPQKLIIHVKRDVECRTEDHHDDNKLNEETDIPVGAKGVESTVDLRQALDRKWEELGRINRDSEHMATDFDVEKSLLESRVVEIEKENRRYAQEVESLREQLVQALKETEALQTERQRHETELLNEKEERARQVEEERKARELAEAQYQEHMHALQQQISRVETEKKWAEAEYEADIRAERERLLSLEADLQRQVEEKEEEEMARLAEEECKRARLEDTIGRARQQVEKAIADQELREREAAFASQSQAEVQALLLEKQSQALQHEKERYQRQILEETESVRRTLEEVYNKKEQKARAHWEAEEVRVQQLEEQQYLSLEKERRRLSFLEEFALEQAENNAEKDHLHRPRESEMLRQTREAVAVKLEQERQQAKLREESFKKQVEEEIARVCKVMEQELAEKEHQAMEARRAARLSRALALEAHEKARLAEEYKRKNGPGGEWVVLYRRVAEAEDYRRQLEHQQVLNCALTVLEKFHSLCTLAEVK